MGKWRLHLSVHRHDRLPWLAFCLLEHPAHVLGTYESENHRMVWVDKDHSDHLVSTFLLCAGSPTLMTSCCVQALNADDPAFSWWNLLEVLSLLFSVPEPFLRGASLLKGCSSGCAEGLEHSLSQWRLIQMFCCSLVKIVNVFAFQHSQSRLDNAKDLNTMHFNANTKGKKYSRHHRG